MLIVFVQLLALFPAASLPLLPLLPALALLSLPAVEEQAASTHAAASMDAVANSLFVFIDMISLPGSLRTGVMRRR
ncbi:hypothetical protein [Microbispora sp. H10830]|uniref:hypothetical protein n=1 Tax=Microbispora sp. H10830 TaxID=2729109 RepID=UPI001C726828|nr:hypothetical protein [Microbispora sp. H10830]